MIPVSVVIPSLNSEKEIQRALDSLLPQLIKGDEVIIIDGASKDATLEIACRYGCKIYIYPGASIGRARHYGVEVAENEIVLQTDTDVVFLPDFMSLLRKHFEDPEVVGVTGSWLDGKNRLLGNVTCKVFEGVFKYSDCLQAYRKSVYYETLGHPDVSFGEQIGNWSQISKRGKVVYDPNIRVLHFSERNVNIPSYIIGSSVLGGGLAYKYGGGGDMSYMAIGHGLGWIAGQFGSETLAKIPGVPEYWEENPDHFHHWKMGALIVAASAAFSGVLPDAVEYGLYGLGSGLFVHDMMTESMPLPELVPVVDLKISTERPKILVLTPT